MIVISPTSNWLRQTLNQCQLSVEAASPYVGGYLADMLGDLDSSVRITLLTRTLMTDFASGASDLDAVIAIARKAGGVLSLGALHAKVYVVDRKIALVTSANGTYSGLRQNRECGLLTNNPSEIGALSEHIQKGFGSSPVPQRWQVPDLEALRPGVESLKRLLPKLKGMAAASEQPPKLELNRRELAAITTSLPGWLGLAWQGISTIQATHFTMEEATLSCASLIRETYPSNQHPRAKLRQQMQRLRDLGLVNFLGKGSYELMIRAR
ncbi:MAG: hypothetical protein CJBNEKGG_01916 [Prosthecobacter sp.]|nr:hypothetical protein [Prosthecobacter sp.]